MAACAGLCALVLAAQGRPDLPPFEPRLPAIDPSKAVVDPFARVRAPIYPDRLKSIAPLTPGEDVELPVPSGMDFKEAKIFIENAETGEVWELPKRSQRRVLARPSKFAVSNVRVPVVQGRPGFVAPQVPTGSYRVYYQQGATTGPKSTIKIQQELVVSGRRSHVLDNDFTLRVSLAGPRLAPATVKVRTQGFTSPTGVSAAGGLINLRRPPTVVRLNVDVAEFGNLGLESNPRVRMSDQGEAVFRFAGPRAGDQTVTFRAENVKDGLKAIRILPRSAPPVIEDPNRPLRLVVFGDSVAWGQGLKPENKYSGLVEAWVESQTNRLANTLTFAHSGGTLQTGDNVNGERRLPGEVPVWFPSVERQIQYARDDLDGNPVDLVLMNGGANDVEIFKVVDPFADNEDEIRATAAALEDDMHEAILEVGRSFEFRKSLIVYTGYYPIVSSESQIKLMASALYGVLVLLPSLEAQVIAFISVSAFELFIAAVQPMLVEKSRAFYEGLTEAIQSAVASANTELGQNRVVFVDPGFNARHAYAGPDTLLWTFGVEDQVAGQRQLEGAQYVLEAPPTPVASVGHPNDKGARRYADRIIETISTAARRTIWDGTRARKVMTASTNSTFDIPTGRNQAELSFNVQARDAATGASLAGDVYVGGVFAGKTNTTIRRTFRTPTTASPKPQILVVKPGFADAELAYQIR